MTMIKKDPSTTLSLLTYELFLTIGPNCIKSDHYTSKKKASNNNFANFKLIKNNH